MQTEPKHLQVFAFILEYKARHDGNSPSFREIMNGAAISTLSLVHHYLDQLEAEGHITRPLRRSKTNRSACNIEVVGGHWLYRHPVSAELSELEIKDRIFASAPFEPFRNDQTVAELSRVSTVILSAHPILSFTVKENSHE